MDPTILIKRKLEDDPSALVVGFPYLISYVFFMDAWSLQMDLTCEHYFVHAFHVFFSFAFQCV